VLEMEISNLYLGKTDLLLDLFFLEPALALACQLNSKKLIESKSIIQDDDVLIHGCQADYDCNPPADVQLFILSKLNTRLSIKFL
jgi:hypothetical protein